MKCCTFFSLVVFIWCVCLGASAVAQQKPRIPSAPNVNSGIDVQADDLSYDAQRNLLIGRGNVRVALGADSLRSDYAEVDTEEGEVYARGNILIQYQGNVWRGDEVTYNFKTAQGDFGSFTASLPPFHVTAADSRRVSENVMEMKQVLLTTCDPEGYPEYSVRASSATLEGERILRAKNLRLQIGPVPFFWFPYLRADLKGWSNVEITPGYSSDMGAFVLGGYKYSINDYLSTYTHLDYRYKRGVGVGEDLMWKDPNQGRYEGKVGVYYTHDKNPWHDDDQRLKREPLIDESRYWIHVDGRQSLTDRDYILAELNYVSDPWMLHDFFDDEYQENVQPENRFTLMHRGDRYTAGLSLNMRLNDFYENVDRLPEVFLNVNRQQILDTPFYYEGENTLSYLNRVFPEDEGFTSPFSSTREDYDVFRLDTYHMFYWPTRHFGFLNVMPRAGYRGTYYSKQMDSQVVTNMVPVTDEEGNSSVTSEVETLYSDGSAVWRSLPELGVESSFKGFKELYRGPTGIEEDVGLRHVFEPYADYTLRFDPNVDADELWQFDSIDQLGKRHDVMVGIRNKLQTRRYRSIHDLIYLDVFTTLLLEPEDDEDVFSEFGFKAEVRPFSWLSWDFDGVVDVDDGSLRTFNTQMQLRNSDYYQASLDYRYSDDIRNQIAVDGTLFPNQPWSFRVYARYDIENSNLEEHSYYIVRRTKCLGLGLGLRIRPDEAASGDDDYSVWVRVWPLAFPGFAK